MRINEIKYLRKFNLGNWEHEEISVGVAVDEDENPLEVLSQMKQFVHSRGIIGMTTAAEPSVETQNKQEPPESEVSKPVPIKNKKKAKEEPVAAEKVKEEEEAPPPHKKFKARGITKYSRALDIHKKLVVDYLDVMHPAWRKDESLKVKAKEASSKLENQDFLDAEGLILPSFKQALDKELHV